MGALTSFAIQVAIVLALEYLVYKWLLADTTFFRYNRMVIMWSYALALAAVPLFRLAEGLFPSPAMLGVVDVGAPIAKVLAGAGEERSPWMLVAIAYAAGVAIAAGLTAFSYAQLFRLMRSGRRIDCGDYRLVVVPAGIAPFSWGRSVIVSEADFAAGLGMVLEHELAHIRCRHSLDLAVAQAFVIFNWFNPAAYLMRRELSAVQEYEADREVLLSGASPREYQMLLIKKTVGAGFQAIANSLNHSQLKNRLTMMLRKESKSVRRIAAAVLLPAAIAAAALTDVPAVAAVIENVGAVSFGKVSESLADGQIAVQEVAASAAVANPEVLPVFKGGIEEMYRALATSMRYPEDAQKAKAQGRVVVQFVVTTKGTITDVKVDKSANFPSLDAEAVRVVKEELASGWTPGRNGGQPVDCLYSLPVTFKLQ